MNADQPIAVTVGEPAGIGPDLLVRIAHLGEASRLLIIGDPAVLASRAESLGTPVRIHETDASSFAEKALSSGELAVLPIRLPCRVVPGQPDVGNVPATLQTVDVACDLCLIDQACAMVTNALNKGIINQAGVPFTGHTEHLAARCGDVQPVMVLVCPELRVALHTTHLPLSEVPSALSFESLERTLRIVHRDAARFFALVKPKILVCGLNPHAGEGGYLGKEEIEIMQPVLNKLRAEGMGLDGPVSADTAFSKENRRHYDVFVCMYHDQGLPVLKALGFGQAVNISLGLPIVRTSVDHGTALPLAGTGRADASSLCAAISAAAEIADKLQNRAD